MTLTSPKLQGLGGWLIFVGIGLVVRPLWLLTNEAPALIGLLTHGVWQSRTTPGSPEYHPLWRYTLGLELGGNLGVLLVEVWLLALFFRRSPRFPVSFIALALFLPAFILVDAWLYTRIVPEEPLWDPATIQNFSYTAVQALIWVPYMLLSKRVKATFLVSSPEKAVAASWAA